MLLRDVIEGIGKDLFVEIKNEMTKAAQTADEEDGVR